MTTRTVFLDSFSDGCFTVQSRSGKQGMDFEDSDRFGPAKINMRTGDVSPIPDKSWFWAFYTPWRKAGRPTEGEPRTTPCEPLQKAVWAKEA